ncbi:uncharacterized protein LOC132179384 [Corylus avellana]|uniref:uncharacterized protein LOC132179384 n=1 Tax=Corylus avellana TaxID=13451 RepID=UPI00286CA398|nr:uncharacterized protein LOC132179384 [Corylus avellana]XP_059448088.1 uncharacterized protein LOC132179384 [Corylus avellana]XP_059448089.1 uncharacterized protein LOC132179384 [Corylus avellana]
MSRCFPFPPPGYEKKARTEDVDLLKKEREREKKHKKEKRDKEKREGKEKREKDRSDGKHKEKKDKKEKSRDKKKDKEKDRDKDKEKNSAPDEKRLTGQAEGHSGEKLIQKEERDKGKNSIPEKRFVGQFSGYNAEKLSDSSHLAKETMDSKFMQELGRRIKDDDKATENTMEKFTNMDRKKDEEMVKLLAKGTGTWAEGKEKNRRNDERTMDGRGINCEARFSGNSMVQNPVGVFQTRVEGTLRPSEKKVEEKEKTKEKEGDDKRGDKRKDKDREKKSQGKDKDRDKEKKKEEKAKVKNNQKNTEHDRLKESNKSDLIGSQNIKTPQLPKDSNKIAASEENLKKRKEVETNGVLHASDVRPNKLARPTSSSHRFPENGRTMDHSQTSITNASDRHVAASNVKVDNKERKINGIIDQPSSVSSKKPMFATAQADQIAEAAAKPPHPDSKYLSQVYTIPKMEEWSHYDDQEWLFSNNGYQSELPKVGSSEVEETPEVWAEAMRIESADVCALPYVIPY